MTTEKQAPEALSDAEYLRLVARHYAHSWRSRRGVAADERSPVGRLRTQPFEVGS